jgi:hypothetical protein
MEEFANYKYNVNKNFLMKNIFYLKIKLNNYSIHILATGFEPRKNLY